MLIQICLNRTTYLIMISQNVISIDDFVGGLIDKKHNNARKNAFSPADMLTSHAIRNAAISSTLDVTSSNASTSAKSEELENVDEIVKNNYFTGNRNELTDLTLIYLITAVPPPALSSPLSPLSPLKSTDEVFNILFQHRPTQGNVRRRLEHLLYRAAGAKQRAFKRDSSY